MNAEHLNSTPARWWTVLGLVLVPLLVAGGFLLAGMHADERLHTVQAAVVNLDEPVTLDGQYTPLGRQLTANLVDSDRQQNLTWVLQNETEARAGLADGRFAAMVIIPENFSAAATSFAEDADQAKQAEIRVYTSPVAGVADATLGKLVANEAAAMLNQTLTQSYLENIYIGFNDMGDQFVTLADGSSDLADGAEKLADGLRKANAGGYQLAEGTRALAEGLGEMKTQTKGLPKDIRKLADGTGDLADGLNQYVGGVNQLIGQLSDAQLSEAERAQLQLLKSGATGLKQGLAATQVGLGAAADNCPQEISDYGPGGCAGWAAAMTQAAASFDAKSGQNPSLNELATSLDTGVGQLVDQTLAAAPDAGTIAKLEGLREAGNKLSSGAGDLAEGTDELADGMPKLVDGIAQSASGADELAEGISQFSDGINDAASGATKLADGMREMADGIADGKDNVPSFNQTERENLSTVVASPIDTDDLHGLADGNVGWVSLILVLALWLGALATYAVIKAINRGLLNSAEPSYLLIGKALLPGIAVVGAQAVVMAVLAWFGFELSWQKWLAASAVLVLAGITFVVINHALVAWFDGIGRLVSVLFAVLTAAAAMSGAAPGIFAALRPFSPLSPALDAVRAIVTESSGAATSTLTLVGWLLLALVASAVAIVRKRTTTLEAVVAAG